MAEATAASALRRRSPHPFPEVLRGPREPHEPIAARRRCEGLDGRIVKHVDAEMVPNVCLVPVVRTSLMTEARLSSLYESEGLGGEKTMRAK